MVQTKFTNEISWQQDLMQRLIKAVDCRFSPQTVSYEQVRDYIKSISVVKCYNEQIAKVIYDMYLDKLRESGNTLSEKMKE